MKRKVLVLPEELCERLEREANRRKTSVSEVARECLDRSLLPPSDAPEMQGMRHVGFAGVGASGFTDTAERFEEIFEELWKRGRTGVRLLPT